MLEKEAGQHGGAMGNKENTGGWAGVEAAF